MSNLNQFERSSTSVTGTFYMQKNNNIPLLSNDSKTKNKNQEEKFLKTGEVAKLLNVTGRTINFWAKNGILIPDHTINGYNYYTEQQITNFLQTAKNLLPNSQNREKSPTIKNKNILLKKW